MSKLFPIIVKKTIITSGAGPNPTDALKLQFTFPDTSLGQTDNIKFAFTFPDVNAALSEGTGLKITGLGDTNALPADVLARLNLGLAETNLVPTSVDTYLLRALYGDTIPAGGSGGSPTTVSFTSGGANTFTLPAGNVITLIQCWGPGGGGGANAGSGGGGGAYSESNNFAGVGGTTYNYVVGTGGIAGASNGPGGDGSDTTFNATTTVAKAGKGGLAGSGSPNAQGGLASAGTGTTTFSGGNGGTSGGGGGAGTTGNGGNAPGGSTNTGGTGASVGGGNGGTAPAAGSPAGGGGSGGGALANGTAAADGRLDITYAPATSAADALKSLKITGLGDVNTAPTSTNQFTLRNWQSGSTGTSNVTSPTNADGPNDGALATLTTALLGAGTATLTSLLGTTLPAGVTSFTTAIYRCWYVFSTTLPTSLYNIVGHSSSALFSDVAIVASNAVNVNHLTGDFTFDLVAAGVNTIAKLKSLQIVFTESDAVAGVTPAVMQVDAGCIELTGVF